MKTLSPPMRRVVAGSWIMIAVLTLVTVILYVDNRRTKECLADYIKADYAATAPRIQAVGETDLAVDKMVESVLGADTREESVAALQEYRTTRQKASAQIANHLPPPFPEKCS